MDRKTAERELENWGRWLYSDMDCHGIASSGHMVPPTSSGYHTPVYLDGETPEGRCLIPVDEIQGMLTNDLVVKIGRHNHDAHRALVYWYRTMENSQTWPRTIRKRMARLLGVNQIEAERILEYGITLYCAYRLTGRGKKP